MPAQRFDGPRSVALAAGVVVAAFAAAVLTAWAVHFVPLIQVPPGAPPLTRQGAQCEFLLGVALACLAAGWRRAAVVCAAVVLALTVTVGFEYALDRDFGIDQLLGNDYIRATSPPGRISPAAAFCYFCAALALLALGSRMLGRFSVAIAGIIASMLVAVAAVMFLSHVVGQDSIYAWGRFRAISSQASLAVMFLGAGIMALALAASRTAKTRPMWLPAGLAVGLSAAALGVWQALMIHEASQLPMLSHIVLGGGVASALLIAIAVSQAQKAWLRSRELEEGKTAFERLFNASGDALLVVGRDGRILRANQRIQALFGYTPEEIVGKQSEILLPTRLRATHPSQREDFFAHPQPRSVGATVDAYGKRKDGSEFPVDISLSPLQADRELQVLASVRDITERKQAEEALRQSEERFRSVYENSPLGLALVNLDYGYLSVNESYCRMLGYSAAELKSMNPLEVAHPDDREEVRRFSRALRAGTIPTYKIEKRYIKKNGDIIWTNFRATAIRDRQGRFLYGLGIIEDITERKRAQESLLESEERFRKVFENSPLGLALVYPDYKIMKVNESMARMLGYSEAEIDSLSPLDFTHPEDKEESSMLAQKLFRGEIPSYNIEKRYLKKNGEIIWASLIVTVIRDREGRILYSLGIIEDITERKLAQEALRDSEERFRGIFETSPLGLGLIGLDYRLVKVNESLVRMSGYSEAELLTMNTLDYTHPDDVEESARLSQSLFRGEIPSYHVEKRYVKKDGETIWVTLTATILHDREGRPAYCLGMIEDITERKKAETELRLAAEVLDNMQEGVCLIHMQDGVIVQANRKFETMYGYGPGEMAGLHVSAMNAPGRPSQEIENEIRAAVLGSGSWRGELLQRRKDGRTFWSSVTASRLRHHQYGLVGISIHQDITERKRAEESLRQSEEHFRGLFEQSPIGVSLMEKNYRFFKVNAAMCRMMGYSEAELTKMTALDITHPEDRGPTREFTQELFGEDFGSQKLEKRYITKSGAVIWGRVNASVLHDSQGKPMYALGMIEDITERKRAEEELSVLSQRLSLAVRSAALGVWDWDLRTDQAIWNERMFQIFSVAPKPHVSREDWESRIHPEDRPRVSRFLTASIRTRAPQSVEFRLALPDGSIRFVAAVAGATREEKGDTSGMVGVVGVALDITERKQAEQKLAEQAALLDLAHDAIFVTDLNGTIRFWGRGARDTYGFSSEEALGRISDQLLETEFPADIHEIQAAFLAKGGWEGELVHTTRDGRKLIMACRWSLERDDTGTPHAVLEINRDITARKELEEQIETSREQSAAAARLSALGMMAGGVAHEINNPLAIIHALASDLIEAVEEHGTVAPDIVARSSRRILETTERIAHIVKSLRKISREGTKDRYYPVRIGKILSETLEVTRARFEARGVKLMLPTSIPDLTISCREVQIEQVVLNLLQNAFDAVVDLTGERWVRVDVASREGAAVVSVIDSGPGIPYDLRDYVGQPFFTTKEVGKGAGLGLSLSRTIAEEHGGRVEYDDESGHTRFSLVLPLARQVEAA